MKTIAMQKLCWWKWNTHI